MCACYVHSHMAVLMDWAVGSIPLPSCRELDQGYGLICLEGKLGLLSCVKAASSGGNGRIFSYTLSLFCASLVLAQPPPVTCLVFARLFSP